MQGMSSDKKSNLIYAAILSGNADRLAAALANKPDLDADDAKALRLCAQEGNYRFAKQLYLAGADPAYALMCEKNGKEPRTAVIARLGTYKEAFENSIAPAETLRMLQEILDRQQRLEKQVQAFKDALAELAEPQRLDKPEMKTPPGSPHFDTKGHKP
ncbi:MAG: hypothetical protein GC185_04665 [Alphaproteobacteria bacterium]|nr:hypothetical protein [Alphaproteobacteria bacterium]